MWESDSDLWGEKVDGSERGLSHVLFPDIKPKFLVLLESMTHRISTEWQGLNNWFLVKLKTNHVCYNYLSLSSTYSKVKAYLVILLRRQNPDSNLGRSRTLYWGDMSMEMYHECGWTAWVSCVEAGVCFLMRSTESELVIGALCFWERVNNFKKAYNLYQR